MVESSDEETCADLYDVPSSKFDRILRFVEQHDIMGTCSSAFMGEAEEEEDAAASGEWHHSYDEEAEEGCDDGFAVAPHEAQQLMAAQASLSAAAVPAVACSVAFLYPAAAEQQHEAAPGAVGSLAYFLAKPLDQSYDEEAEGCYEAAAAEAAVSARALKAASMVQRRAESRAVARERRAALRLSIGDLEAMQPWVADEAVAAAAAAVKRAAGRMPTARYPHLQAFLAARVGAMEVVESAFEALQRERGLQARLPQAWQYTWDEEAHGSSVLSSM